MKDLITFAKNNLRELDFGGSMTLLSSFGQTFLVSLFVPEIIKVFEMSEGTFGSIYALCTVAASVVMLTVGHTIDHKPVKKVVLFTFLGMIVSLVLLSVSHYHIAVLMLSLAGLRLTGQGLSSHISLTVMSRYYKKDRGKALSFSTLGYSVGEFVFPVLLSASIIRFGFETSALLCAGFVCLYLVRLLLKPLKRFDANPDAVIKPSPLTLIKDYKAIFTDRRFNIIMPASFVLGFTTTAVFFYQYIFVENKQWSVTLYASFFSAYAVTRFVMSLVVGVLVDKFSAKTLFRFYLLPMTIGLVPFAFMDSIMGALLFLIGAGCTMGLSSTVKTAVLAESYGTEKLGTVRSLFTMFMVISTAIGPLTLGLLIDAGLAFQWIILILVGLMVLAVLNAQRIWSI